MTVTQKMDTATHQVFRWMVLRNSQAGFMKKVSAGLLPVCPSRLAAVSTGVLPVLQNSPHSTFLTCGSFYERGPLLDFQLLGLRRAALLLAVHVAVPSEVWSHVASWPRIPVMSPGPTLWLS